MTMIDMIYPVLLHINWRRLRAGGREGGKHMLCFGSGLAYMHARQAVARMCRVRLFGVGSGYICPTDKYYVGGVCVGRG